jgi:hypothetical protein
MPPILDCLVYGVLMICILCSAAGVMDVLSGEGDVEDYLASMLW